MKCRTILLLSLVLPLVGCVSVEELPPGVKVEGALPPGTKSVVITAVPAKPGAIRNAGKLMNVPQLFARNVRDALAQKRPDLQLRIAEDARHAPDRDVTVTTEVLEIDGGSAGLRFWIGFGAGATQARAKVTLLDRAGNPIASAEISERATCPLAVCGDTNEEMVQAGLQRLAVDVADFAVDPAGYQKRKRSNP